MAPTKVPPLTEEESERVAKRATRHVNAIREDPDFPERAVSLLHKLCGGFKDQHHPLLYDFEDLVECTARQSSKVQELREHVHGLKEDIRRLKESDGVKERIRFRQQQLTNEIADEDQPRSRLVVTGDGEGEIVNKKTSVKVGDIWSVVNHTGHTAAIHFAEIVKLEEGGRVYVRFLEACRDVKGSGPYALTSVWSEVPVTSLYRLLDHAEVTNLLSERPVRKTLSGIYIRSHPGDAL